jgi:hypothetical protein
MPMKLILLFYDGWLIRIKVAYECQVSRWIWKSDVYFDVLPPCPVSPRWHCGVDAESSCDQRA